MYSNSLHTSQLQGPKVDGASLDLCNMMVFNNATRYLHWKVLRKERNHSNGDILIFAISKKITTILA